MKRKSAEDYNTREILEWVGGGPKKTGLWKLTDEQVKQFTVKQGIIYCTPLFRYTRWWITESGVIRWEEARKRDFEEVSK